MKKRLVLAFFVFFLMFGGFFLLRYDFFRSAALDASYPFFFLFERLKDYTDYISDFIRSRDDLINKNRELEKRMELLKAHIIELKSVKKENLKLKSILNFVSRLTDYDFVTARVIGFSPDKWNSFLIIDAGSFDGVKKGDIVIFDGYLLGQIYQTGSFSSTVITVGDRNFRISARCRKTGESVFFQGEKEREGFLLYVRPEQDVRIGDIIETFGSPERGIPSGIPIGTVKSVSYIEGDFFKTVKVSIGVNILRADYVVVVKGNKK